jgi:hypothetical protein
VDRGIITTSRTACARAEQEVSSAKKVRCRRKGIISEVTGNKRAILQGQYMICTQLDLISRVWQASSPNLLELFAPTQPKQNERFCSICPAERTALRPHGEAERTSRPGRQERALSGSSLASRRLCPRPPPQKAGRGRGVLHGRGGLGCIAKDPDPTTLPIAAGKRAAVASSGAACVLQIPRRGLLGPELRTP